MDGETTVCKGKVMKMRKSVFVLLGVILLVSLAGCGQSQDYLQTKNQPNQLADESLTPEPEPTESEPEATATAEPEPTATEPPFDAARAYLDTLEYFYQYMLMDNPELDYELGNAGIWEQIVHENSEDMLEKTGFAIIDLSGDGLPELMIGYIDEEISPDSLGTLTYAVFALKDNQPVLTVQGWFRNTHYYHSDGRFKQFGSNGWMHYVSGIYKLSLDGLTLNCEHYFFTWEKDETLTEIVNYYNTICKDDRSLSVELSEEETIQKNVELYIEPVPIELIPFADLPQWQEEHGFPRIEITPTNPADAIVTVDYAGQNILNGRDRYSKVMIHATQPPEILIVKVSKTVTDFKYFEISLTDCVEDKCYFDIVEEIDSTNSVSPELPVLIGIGFRGSIPDRGISFVDETGTTRYYSINQSGKDGSVFLLEFEYPQP